MVQRWSRAIGECLSHTDFVCELHFSNDSIIKEDRIKMPDGTIEVIPHLRHTLIADAMPIAVHNKENGGQPEQNVPCDQLAGPSHGSVAICNDAVVHQVPTTCHDFLTPTEVYWKTPRGKPNYLPRTIERKEFRFTSNRPWTRSFWLQNSPGTRLPMVHVEPIRDWSFFRGDRVEILVGIDKGKQGLVTQIVAERNWVYVDGLNTHLRMIGKEENGFPGVCVKSEAPLLVTTDIRLVDPSDLKATTIEWRYTSEGDRVRVSTRTGRIIPIPVANLETIDYKLPHLYKERPKDTLKEDVEEITFKAEHKTFEMDVMDKMGIKEDRVPKQYWWY